MGAPGFSVIIAAHNAATTIGRAIESILAQTEPPLEIIVVDDGSVDETAVIVREFGERVRYHHQTNHGVAVSRNVGVNLARGDWVAFLDADDIYYPNRLQDHRELLARFPDVDFMTGDIEFRTPQGELIKRFIESVQIGKRVLDRARGDIYQTIDYMEIGDFIAEHFGNTNTLSVTRKKFIELGGYPEEYHVCEDVAFLIRLCASSRRIGAVCRPIAVYYIHAQSATRRSPLTSQLQTVSALISLRHELRDAPAHIRAGLERRIRSARLGLAYVALRMKKRYLALKAAFPLLIGGGTVGVRDFLSICRGVVAR